MVLAVLGLSLPSAPVYGQALADSSAHFVELPAEARPASPVVMLRTEPGIDPVQSWVPPEWPNARLLGAPLGTVRAAGDITGNGTSDVVIMHSTHDDRDFPAGAPIQKSLVYFDGDLEGLPDQEIYGDLFPIGDFTGNGNADALVREGDDWVFYTGSSSGYIGTGVISEVSPDRPAIGDLSGDGSYEFVSRRQGINQFSISLGTDDLGTQTVITHDIEGWAFSLAVGRVHESHSRDRIVLYSTDQPHRRLQVLRLDDQNELHIESEIDFGPVGPTPANSVEPYLADATGNGIMDFILGDLERIYFFEGSLVDGNVEYSATLVEWIGERITPVGDVDGDGIQDYYFRTLVGGVDTRAIAFGPENLDDGPSPDYVLNPEGENIREVAALGDLTGSGLESFTFRYFLDDSFGQRVIHGDEGHDFGVSDHNYPREDYAIDLVRATYNLGDISGDGHDDLAILYHGDDQPFHDSLDPRVEIYFGGDGLSGPPSVIVTRDGAEPHNITAGDFSGIGRTVVISWYFPEHLSVRGGSELAFYPDIGAGSTTPNSVVALADLHPNRLAHYLSTGFGNIANIGDVNNDGLHDLLVTMPHEWHFNGSRMTKAFLYPGAAQFPGEPVEIELGDIPGFYAAGMAIGRLGDVSGNGVDDVAIGLMGSIAVFFGHADGSTDFTVPDRLFEIVEVPGHSDAWVIGVSGIAAGDFNGNGYNDIAYKVYQFHNTDGQGGPGVYLHYGGPGISNQPDELLAVPADGLLIDPTATDSYLFDNLGEISAVPDPRDGSRDVLFISTIGGRWTGQPINQTNARLFGLGPDGLEPGLLFKAPNQHSGLGADNNDVSFRYRSAIGDFNGDGVPSVAFPQPWDRNYRGTPVHLFPIDTAAVDIEVPGVIGDYVLDAPFPNPASGPVTIRLEIPDWQHLQVVVYDLLGRPVRTLIDGEVAGGRHEVMLETSGLASGLYFLRMSAGSFSQTRRLIVVR